MDSERAPAGLPMLQRGRHIDPSTGACFMEYASLLAGERWSDHPRCTHPALAQLARMLNDAVSDETRQRLAVLTPDVVGLNARDAGLAPALVRYCLTFEPVANQRPWTRWQLTRVQRRSAAAAGAGFAGRWCRLSDPAYRLGTARRVMARTVRRLVADDDERVVELLGGAIRLARRRYASTGTAVHTSAQPISANLRQE